MQALAKELRELVRQTLPGVTEAVYPGWKLIGYRMPQTRGSVYVGFVAPLADRVVLGFEWGVLMPDPKGLLTGDGRQVRQIVIRRMQDIHPAPFATLIKEAARVAALPKPEKQRLRYERAVREDAKKHGLAE